MRGARAFVVLTVYVSLLSALVAIIYLAIAASSASASSSLRTTGKVVFGAIIFLQTAIVLFIAPAFTAGAIAGERERQTYDILRTTLLPAGELVRGKLLSALAFLGLLIGAAIPLEGIAFLLGGLSLIELVASQLMLGAAVVTYCLLGLYLSSAMRSTMPASVTTIGLIVVGTVGVPMGALILFSVVSPFFLASSPNPWLAAGFVYTGIFLSATNLPAALIVSEVLLVQENAVWLARIPLSGTSVPVPSPWYLMIIFHLLFSLFLYHLTVRRVRRLADR